MYFSILIKLRQYINLSVLQIFFKKYLFFIFTHDILYFVLSWPIGQAVKTRPSQGRIMGSIPVWVTKFNQRKPWKYLFFKVFSLHKVSQNYGKSRQNYCKNKIHQNWQGFYLFFHVFILEHYKKYILQKYYLSPFLLILSIIDKPAKKLYILIGDFYDY